MKTDSQIGLRVTAEFKARIEAQAERECRSVSNLILKVMSEYLDACDAKPDDGGR